VTHASRLADAYCVEPLGSHHDRVAFSCGVPSLDDYLRTQASQDARRSVAVTFVAVLSEVPRVVADYYTLAATGIDAGALPPALARKLPRYPTLPATLLGRLAVDERNHGQGLGEYLLVHALRRALTVSREVASLAVIVDAIDERAHAFYEHFEFLAFPDEPRRLFLPTATIARLFGENT
jgi:GNAT superfamily N-acetyltransferase